MIFKVLLELLIVFIPLACGYSCVKQLGPCKCETDKWGQIVDFSPLDSGGNTQINWRASDDRGGTYEYNPCSPIYCATQVNAALCFLNDTILMGESLGDQSNATFLNVDNDDYSIMIRYYGIAAGYHSLSFIFHSVFYKTIEIRVRKTD